MAKKKLFTEDVDNKLPFIRKTGKIETPKKSTSAKKKTGEIEKVRRKNKVGKLSKLSLPDKSDKQSASNSLASSATGRQIHPGRYEKRRKDGALSRQGERARSEMLLNAVRATFHIDQELLLEFKAKAKQEGRGLSELANIAIKQYLKGKK